ncbi:hypothetical protein [Streptomyces sp. NPDC088739]|uniref:hypothetical protein n=1 Tax=Streptomyces sp. NPDC088739 TaxID=3365882 RepID=UPI0038053A57
MHAEPLPDVVETLTLAPTAVRLTPRVPVTGLDRTGSRMWTFAQPLAATVRQITMYQGMPTFGDPLRVLAAVAQVLVTVEYDGRGRSGPDADADGEAAVELAAQLRREAPFEVGIELWEPNRAGRAWQYLFVPLWRGPRPRGHGGDSGRVVVEGAAGRVGQLAWDCPPDVTGAPVALGASSWFRTYRTAVAPPVALGK